jgi:hypothetical protein
MRPRESAVVWVLATPSSHGAAVRVRRGKFRVHIRDFAVGARGCVFEARVFGLCSSSRSRKCACCVHLELVMHRVEVNLSILYDHE